MRTFGEKNDITQKYVKTEKCAYITRKIMTFTIGGFRDTYLGREVVSRPGGPRAGMGLAGGLRKRCELPAGSGGSGAEPQPKSNLVPF